MRYTGDKAFEEVMKRSRVFKLRHIKKVASTLSGAASVLMVLIVMAISGFGNVGVGMSGEGAYGSFLLPTQAGGYVLAAVIAFDLGVFVTYFIHRFKSNREKELD